MPQGSVLGPTLRCYINDLPDSIPNSEIFLYANDTKLFRKIKEKIVSNYKRIWKV